MPREWQKLNQKAHSLTSGLFMWKAESNMAPNAPCLLVFTPLCNPLTSSIDLLICV